MMDVAVPANMRQGLHQEEVARLGWALSAEQAIGLIGRQTSRLSICGRNPSASGAGAIPRSLHAPYSDLAENLDEGGLLHELASAREDRWCSIAPSANAPRWRCAPRRTEGSQPRGTSRAESRPGRAPAGR